MYSSKLQKKILMCNSIYREHYVEFYSLRGILQIYSSIVKEHSTHVYINNSKFEIKYNRCYF
jgi:hypothetical protein